MVHKVLWLSRHAMSGQQLADLKMHEGVDVEVIHVNALFPSQGSQAVYYILGLAHQTGCGKIAGVFPAHIAVAFAEWLRGQEGPSFKLYLPVNKPAPANEGETRPFVHSHWEWV